MTPGYQKLRQRIDENVRRVNAHRPLKPAVLSKLREQFSLELTFNSNAIEGNRLTMKETYLVLREGMTVKGKSLAEHLEAKNHAEAIQFLFELIDAKQKVSLSHHLIRQIHQLIVRDTDGKSAGVYRKTDVQILGSRHLPPPGHRVQTAMDTFLKELNLRSKHHPLEWAAWAHHRFVNIHPFEDGNGRTGRLLMNLLLLRSRYPIAIILKADRVKYYRALERADRGDVEAITQMVAQAVDRSLAIYLRAIQTGTEADDLVTLSVLASRSPYSAKYLNLLAGKGLLPAQKIGRNWYSSVAAVDEYRRSRSRRR